MEDLHSSEEVLRLKKMLISHSKIVLGSLRARGCSKYNQRGNYIAYLRSLPYIKYHQSVESTLQNASYHHSKVPQWTNNVVEQCLKRLTALNKPFKYVGKRDHTNEQIAHMKQLLVL